MPLTKYLHGNGNILLWRKSLGSLVRADAKHRRLWSWRLLRASWKERMVLLGYSPLRLRPGELAVALAGIGTGAGLSRKEVRSGLALGKKTGCLGVRGTARGTPSCFVKWQGCRHPDAEPDLPLGLNFAPCH